MVLKLERERLAVLQLLFFFQRTRHTEGISMVFWPDLLDGAGQG